MFKKFLLVCVIALVAFVVIGVTAANHLGLTDDIFESDSLIGSVIDSIFGNALPERTNILILGTDYVRAGIGRADMMMIMTISGETGKIDLISIPRDTRVTMPQDRLDILRENGRNTASSSGIMRINEVTHHAGPQFGPSFLALQVEELTGVSIDYYLHINLDAFRFIVDEIGGVEFDVPIRMFYQDPYQDLLIDLQPGLQRLDGTMAEGLVRFRSGHADGDLGRMRTQQEFMRVAIGQIISTENIVSNPMAYINVIFNHIDTDFGLLDAPKYLGLINLINAENITAHTLEAEGTRINGRFYYIIDEDAMKEVLDKIY